MTIVSISLPDELLEALDKYMELRGYASRSELIRDLIREQIEALEKLSPETRVSAIIVVLTDHDVSLSVDEKVIATIHRYQPLIKAFYHQLLEDSLCLNIAIVEGEIGLISRLSKALRGIRGVKRIWILHAYPLPRGF